jgi:thiol-disulfide isomerase/thioredoxin
LSIFAASGKLYPHVEETMRSKVLGFIFVAFYSVAVSAAPGRAAITSARQQTAAQNQTTAERSALEYVEEVSQILADANRADVSEQEFTAARDRARQLAAQYAGRVKARNPGGIEKFYLSYLYSLADQPDNALAALREAVGDSSLVEEDKQRVRLSLIEKLSDAGRLKEAETELAAVSDKAFNADEVRAAAHHVLAIACTKAGQLGQALAHEEQALQGARKAGLISLIGKYARALGELYVALDRRDDAARMLAEAKSELERQIGVSAGQMRQGLQRTIAWMQSGLDHLKFVGQPAPEITTVKWIETPPTTLASLKGKVVALEFWAAWCPDCRGFIPHLREWAPRYEKDGLKIVTVTRYYGFNGREANKASPAEEEAFLASFKRARRLPYGVGMDDGQRSFDTYSVSWVPTIVIIDRAGRVRYVFTWHENPSLCETLIKKILAEPATTGN